MKKLSPEEKIISKNRQKLRLKEYYLKNKDKINKYTKEWRKKNPHISKRDNKKWQERRKLIRICCILLKGGECIYCGIKFDGRNGCIFDFHHRNPEEKDFELSHNIKLSTLSEEIEKCDLICSNCHRMIREKGGYICQ